MWFRRHARVLKPSFHIGAAVIPILIGVACFYLEQKGVPVVYLYVFGAIIPAVLYITVISEIAILLFFDHLKEDDRVYVETTYDAVRFANKRAEIVKSIKPESVKRHIISTSHCNLFARPEGVNPDEVEKVGIINKDLFESMAKIALNQNGEGRIRVLFFAPTEDDLEMEIDVREEILDRISQQLGLRWDNDHFGWRRLRAKSLKDYLIIEDHVFKTIRKLEVREHEGEARDQKQKQPYLGTRAKYIHLESKDIADSYREWLRDMFENGAKGGFTDAPRGP
jgi:hypothetical protein